MDIKEDTDLDAAADAAATAEAAAAAAAAAATAVAEIQAPICQPIVADDPPGINTDLVIPPGRKTPLRQCRFPGCVKTIKSQGHCQKHGARAKRCKVQGCDKQAQGTHNGMCKRHWKNVHQPKPPPMQSDLPPEPTGVSVYDQIVPQSIAWKALKTKPAKGAAVKEVAAAIAAATDPDQGVMPLVAHLRDNSHLESGWHRSQERLSRGIRPTPSPSAHFEPWERQLIMFEIMLMAGTFHHSHRDLAHGWGREKGFHSIVVNQVCERRGETERKKRSDQGRQFTPDQRAEFKIKLQKARSESRAKRILAEEQAAQLADPNRKPPAVEEVQTAEGADADETTVNPIANPITVLTDENGDDSEHFADAETTLV